MCGVQADVESLCPRLSYDCAWRLELSLNKMFETSPIPMWIYDVETCKFDKVNQAAIRNYGYSEQEFLSMTIRDIRPAEDVAMLAQRVAPVDGSYPAGLWRHRRKDGSVFTVDIIVHS